MVNNMINSKQAGEVILRNRESYIKHCLRGNIFTTILLLSLHLISLHLINILILHRRQCVLY